MKFKVSRILKILDRLVLPLIHLRDRGKKFVFYPVSEEIKFKIRVNSSDKLALWETWKLGVYNKIKISKGFSVVDIGSHIGGFAVFAAKKTNPGIVFAYEANPVNFELLKTNKKINYCNNLVIFNTAVADKNGIVDFYIQENGGLGSLFVESNDKISVPCITLEKIVKQNKIKKIDLLKLDAEGSEFAILTSAKKDITDKIGSIVLEFHEYRGSNHTAESLKVFLESRGFEVRISKSFLFHKIFRTGYITAKRVNFSPRTKS